MSNEEEENKIRKDREQNRGLFAIGLLAVLISFRLSPDPLIFMGMDISVFIDLNIFFWIIYGFSMLISFSDDFIEKGIRDFFYTTGSMFLLYSNALFILLSIVFSLSLHPERAELSIKLIYTILFVLLFLNIIKAIKKYWNYDKEKIGIKIEEIFTYNNIKDATFSLSLLFTAMIIYLDINDVIVNMLFILGIVAILTYAIVNIFEIADK